MFSNKVRVLVCYPRGSSIPGNYEREVVLPRPIAMAQNWASGSWKFIVRHFHRKPKLFRFLDRFYNVYFKALDVFLGIHWPERVL